MQRSEKTAALALAIFFAAGLAIAAAAAALAERERAELEETLELTAVGDSDFFEVKKPVKLDVVIVRFRGEGLYYGHMKKSSQDDDEMIRAGRDESGRHWIYKRRKKDGTLTPWHYLRLEPGVYRRMSIRPGGQGQK